MAHKYPTKMAQQLDQFLRDIIAAYFNQTKNNFTSSTSKNLIAGQFTSINESHSLTFDFID